MRVEKLNFSVVIPCYNYAQVLTRAVESVVKQEGDDYEVIIVDDGSTDDSADVAKVLAEKYAGLLTYFYKKNGGVSSARNCGIDHSRGDYLLFLDADDEMAEGALTALRDQALLARAPALIVGGHYTQFSSGKTKYHASGTVVKNCELNFLAYIRKLISVANGAIAIHRRVFDDIRYDTEIKQSEDIPVFGQIFARYPCEALDKAIELLRSAKEGILFDQKIRLQALKCWMTTQRNVAGWVSLVYGYMESKDSTERSTYQSNLKDLILKEMDNTEDLLNLLDSGVEFMALTDKGETPLVYGDNLDSLLINKLALMTKHINDVPFIDHNYTERKAGEPII